MTQHGDESPAAQLMPWAAGLAGPVLAVALAGALVSVRDTIGVANVGFLMVIVVLGAAAIGGRGAGILTAGVAALAFNYFHTQPFLSFTIAARQDVISVVLLAVAGGAVGEAGHRAMRQIREGRRDREVQQAFDRLLDTAARGRPIEEVWEELWLVMVRGGAAGCSFVGRGDDALLGDELVIPPSTIVLDVEVRGRRIGRLYLNTGDRRVEPATGQLLRRTARVFELAVAAGAIPPPLLD